MAGKLDTLTDHDVYRNALGGLTSPYAAERLPWARTPLYQLRQYLSPKDFADLAHRQLALSQHDGHPIEGAEPWGLETQMALTVIALASAAPRLWPLLQPMLKGLLKDRPSARRPRRPDFDHEERGTYEPPNVEPPSGSWEAQRAEEELRRLRTEDEKTCDAPSGPP